MRAAIRRLHSPDIGELATWIPPDPVCFAFLLQVLIGPADSDGEESFDFIVATPAWLQRRHGSASVIIGCHHLIVFTYDYARIKSALESLVSSLEGEEWSELANRLGRYGKWEFQDYHG